MDETHQIYSAKQKPAKKHILRLTAYLLNTWFLRHVSTEILDQHKISVRMRGHLTYFWKIA